ncbi:MAG: hypothetical protein AAFZ65_17495, partial [Planctomycetota bacterium]
PDVLMQRSESPADERARALFTSPWLRATKRGEARWKNAWFGRLKADGETIALVRYPDAGHRPAGLLRLLSSALLATRCLRQSSGQGDRSTLAALCAHAFDVLLQYESQLQSRTGDHHGASIEVREFVGLAAHTRHVLRRTVECHDECIEPELFVQLSSRVSGEAEALERFRELFLPQLILRWIENAFVNAVDERGAGRWLRVVDKPPPQIQQQEIRLPFRTRAALLARFFGDSSSLEDAQLDWRDDLRKNHERQGRLSHRLLLLSAPLPASEWSRADWNEAELSPPYRMARAVERLAAVENLTEPDAETLEEWQRDWDELVGAGDEAIAFDRYTVLRLIELLREPSAGLATKRLAMIVAVVLERGSMFAVTRLRDVLFPAGRAEDDPAIDPELQQAAVRSLGSRSRQLQRTRTTKAVSPWVAVLEERMGQLLEETLHRAAHHAFSTPSAGAQTLRKALEAVHASRTPATWGRGRSLQADMVRRGRRRVVRTGSEEDRIAAICWPREVVVDRNRHKVHVVARSKPAGGSFWNPFVQTTDVLASFARPASWEGEEPLRVAGIIVDRRRGPEPRAGHRPGGGDEGQGPLFDVNCGLPVFRTGPLRAPDRGLNRGQLRPDEWLALTIERDGRDWQISRSVEAERLADEYRDGDTAPLALRYAERQSQIVLEHRNDWQPRESWSRSEWMPDSSFAHRLEGTTGKQLGRFESGRWRPVETDLDHDSRGCQSLRCSKTIWLCRSA